jgi:hypothetical protein
MTEREHAWSVRLDDAKGGWVARCSCGWETRRPCWVQGPRRSLRPAARRGGAVVISPAVAAEAERILDREARRLLAARLDADAIRATTGADNSSTDDSLDEVALPLVTEQVPITSADGDSGRGGVE